MINRSLYSKNRLTYFNQTFGGHLTRDLELRAMHLVPIVKLESTISPEFFRVYCKLPNETKRIENMNISLVFFVESSVRSPRDQILFCI